MKKHFLMLDALRGVAALAVVCRHYGIEPFGDASSSYLAVDFFFCLSGFVIALAYEQRLTDGMTLRDFLVARVIRLYPLASLVALIPLAARVVTGALALARPPLKA